MFVKEFVFISGRGLSKLATVSFHVKTPFLIIQTIGQNGLYPLRHTPEESSLNPHSDWSMVTTPPNKRVNTTMSCDKKTDMCQESNWSRGTHLPPKSHGS